MQGKHLKNILLIKRDFSVNFNLAAVSNEIVEKYKSIIALCAHI